MKRSTGRESAAARLWRSFTTPPRFPFLSSLPGTFVFFDCPREQKHARMQQPYWDWRAIKLCRLWRGLLVNKSAADQSNQASIQSFRSPPPQPSQRPPPTNTNRPERPALSIEHVRSRALITRSSSALVLRSIKPVILSASCLGDLSTGSRRGAAQHSAFSFSFFFFLSMKGFCREMTSMRNKEVHRKGRGEVGPKKSQINTSVNARRRRQ